MKIAMNKQSPLIPAEDALTVTKAEATALAPPSIMQAIQLAVDRQSPIEVLERLWAIQQQYAQAEAKRSYSVAMSACQSEIRSVAPDATNPQTHSRYASYKALDDAIRPVYSKHGFSVSFNTEKSSLENCVLVVCEITHREGHSERKSLDMPIVTTGIKGGEMMTRTHATGSAMTYGMRYLLKMAFNVAVGEDDDDGNAGGTMDNLADWLDALAGCNNLEQLKAEYIKALKIAREAKDKGAEQKLEAAKNRRKSELA